MTSCVNGNCVGVSSSVLDAGAIVGIVIGCIAAVALIVGIIVAICCIRKSCPSFHMSIPMMYQQPMQQQNPMQQMGVMNFGFGGEPPYARNSEYAPPSYSAYPNMKV